MTMIRKAEQKDLPILANLACRLWPEQDLAEMQVDLAEIMAQNAAFFLAFADDAPIGFAQCQLRHDYVEGCDTSPVGFLEGIYVEGSHRHTGVARALLGACEDWAKGVGCTEFASDCELTNTQSLHYHPSVGFEEANRIICFTKKL